MNLTIIICLSWKIGIDKVQIKKSLQSSWPVRALEKYYNSETTKCVGLFGAGGNPPVKVVFER